MLAGVWLTSTALLTTTSRDPRAAARSYSPSESSSQRAERRESLSHSDGATLASGGVDHAVRVWDARAGE